VQRTFGQKFDAELIAKFKEKRFNTNEYVADERGTIAWRITRAAQGDVKEAEEILYTEEIVAMLFAYVKMLAET